MTDDKRLEIALHVPRLSGFLVMLMGTLDMFLQPAHSAGVFGWRQNLHLQEGGNLLLFAAGSMPGGCVALHPLRGHDRCTRGRRSPTGVDA
ncbi:MAG: hypothetical protein KGN77_14155 [Xanthomonadaceae bacterium]|nr:hypothetical protein [Xanthomonadaceae bacterium]MDE1964752.1 hypothetical protein [Xanthomonadaceae bacterium]